MHPVNTHVHNKVVASMLRVPDHPNGLPYWLASYHTLLSEALLSSVNPG
jgi:hypothetical protein